MIASTGVPLSKRRRSSSTAVADQRLAATIGQFFTRPRSTAGCPDSMTSRRIAASSSMESSRIAFTDSRMGLPEVDLQRRSGAPGRDARQRVAMVRIVGRAALDEVVDLRQVVARLL